MSAHRYVQHLPDLIDAAEYDQHPQGQLVRLQLSVTDDGVNVLGDAFRPELLEALLRHLGNGDIDQMLCG